MNIEPDSEIPQVKSRFKKVSLILHPDKNNDPRADEAYGKFYQAYSEIMKDLNFLAEYNVPRRKKDTYQYQYGKGICKWLPL